MRKHGLKSASKKARALAAAEEEADETLEFLDSRASLGERHVRGGDLAVHLKQRADKEARLAKVLEGARPPGLCPPAARVGPTGTMHMQHTMQLSMTCVLFRLPVPPCGKTVGATYRHAYPNMCAPLLTLLMTDWNANRHPHSVVRPMI